jgi:ubiquinone/menaquinone biosynthesis C-methylase UbiE
MNLSDKDKIIERYNKRIEQYGSTIQALASGNEERRKMRFQILLECGIQKGDSILDLGCGFGDFYEFLNETLGSGNFNYTGIDINSKIIDIARERFPTVDFRTSDILEEGLNEKFDFIVSTSSFNLKLNDIDNYEFIQNLLNVCYKSSSKGVAIDFLSDYVDFKPTPEAFYYKPEEIFSKAKSITKCVTLRHDYPLFEFCLYLYKDFKGWAV